MRDTCLECGQEIYEDGEYPRFDAAAELADLAANSTVLLDLAENMTCREADTVARFLAAWCGQPEADAFLAAHLEGDTGTEHAGEHECVFGEWQRSRLAGTPFRACTLEGCKNISMDADDDDDPDYEPDDPTDPDGPHYAQTIGEWCAVHSAPHRAGGLLCETVSQESWDA